MGNKCAKNHLKETQELYEKGKFYTSEPIGDCPYDERLGHVQHASQCLERHLNHTQQDWIALREAINKEIQISNEIDNVVMRARAHYADSKRYPDGSTLQLGCFRKAIVELNVFEQHIQTERQKEQHPFWEQAKQINSEFAKAAIKSLQIDSPHYIEIRGLTVSDGATVNVGKITYI